MKSLVMKTHVVGRVRNLRLGADRALVPVYEAIANSLHAITAADVPKGSITIELFRDNSQSSILPDSANIPGPIIGFRIGDNGEGFNDKNLTSFHTAESMLKASGRGIGRFLWLKAFERVSIESVFENGSKRRRRSFRFDLSEKGTSNFKEEDVLDEIGTKVTLSGFLPIYRAKCPLSAKQIADEIINHFLVVFISGRCPTLTLRDGDQPSISLNERFNASVTSNDALRPFKIKEHEFQLYLFKFADRKGDDGLSLCASDRVVKNYKLDKLIPDIAGGLSDDDGRAFTVAAYVLGDLLDESANQERSDFHLEEEEGNTIFDQVSISEIKDKAVSQIREALADIIAPIAEKKIADYTRYVQEEAPEYRSMIHRNPAVLERMPAGLSRENLDGTLNREKFRVNEQLKRETKSFLEKDLEKVTDIAGHFKTYETLVSKLSEYTTDQLAEYVIFRKSVIQLLEKSLGFAEEGKYSKEEVIHRVFFPIRKSSDEVEYADQNLWLIDERLSFHLYLNSDKPIKSVPFMENGDGQRPDLLIFNRAMAYAEPSTPVGSIVIVEFKRPMRDEYDDEDNPIVQVTNYIDSIRRSGLTKADGTEITIPQTVAFYVYIICTLTPKIKRILTVNNAFKPTPDGLGYFDFHQNLNAYIEVVSFDKLVSDAKKRNNMLFKKLNLPID
jgi:hypothetical protein